MAHTSKRGVLSACMILVVLVSPVTGQSRDGKTADLAISVEAHRPLAALADELEKRYRIVVTYEDCPWMNASDLQSVRQVIIAPNGPGPSGPSKAVNAPRKVAVAFSYTAPADNQLVDVSEVLSAFLRQYHGADAPGRFRVEGGRGRYHLIPFSSGGR